MCGVSKRQLGSGVLCVCVTKKKKVSLSPDRAAVFGIIHTETVRKTRVFFSPTRTHMCTSHSTHTRRQNFGIIFFLDFLHRVDV